MKLTILGCGDAFGSGGRFNTSFLLEQGDQRILVDCGASTLIRLKQLGVSVTSIDTIVITHFHGDHYGGIPFLVLSNHIEYKRATPLTIIGPFGVKRMVYSLQEALYPGTSNILELLDITFVEYQDRQWTDVNDLEVYARTVTHAVPSNPHGVKIRWQDKVFAFSGDTEWNDSLVDLADGADVFVVECNNLNEDSPGHLSYQTILSRQTLFNSKRLLLTHMGTEVISQEKLEIERLSDGQEILF